MPRRAKRRWSPAAIDADMRSHGSAMVCAESIYRAAYANDTAVVGCCVVAHLVGVLGEVDVTTVEDAQLAEQLVGDVNPHQVAGVAAASQGRSSPRRPGTRAVRRIRNPVIYANGSPTLGAATTCWPLPSSNPLREATCTTSRRR